MVRIHPETVSFGQAFVLAPLKSSTQRCYDSGFDLAAASA
jgi:hypothetical protein